MSYIKQPVIVLRKKTLRRGNRWYTLLCKDIGKIDVMARSAAHSKSKLAGHLEPGIESEVMLAPGKSIVHLAGVKTIASYKYINLDLTNALLKMTALSATNDLIVDEHDSEKVFAMLQNFLTDLNNNRLHVWQKERLLDMYIINLLAIAGFKPNLSLGHRAEHFSFHKASLVGRDLLDDSAVDPAESYQGRKSPDDLFQGVDPAESYQDRKSPDDLFRRVEVDKNLIKLFEFMLSTDNNWQEKRDWLIRVKQHEPSFDNLHALINKYYFYQVNKELIDIKYTLN